MGLNFSIDSVHAFPSVNLDAEVRVLIVHYPNGMSTTERGPGGYLWFTEEDLYDNEHNAVRYPGDRELFPTAEAAKVDAERWH